ncbi:hypothetical protein BDY19DRAFT_944764 [Irpex rosettiformis]|uniref:Uncharacterized protein n=1 Tax=Irpex rosettiformis TaxID=378272 RepID=A0ACB8U4C2_9APHY|nr:hypothetical protein BDY19DRAFT_944764 [Irpex rosettiformis]
MSSDDVEARSPKRKNSIKSEDEDMGDNSSLAALPLVAQNEQWSRDPRYYFDDGNVVILAEDTIFRVHKGVLSLHSGVFKDLLNLPQPPGGETLDSCPLVRIQDTAFHIKWLLETMYDGAATILLHPKPEAPGSIAALYHLSLIGDKYAVEHLVEYVYKILLVLFPTSDLSHWEPFTKRMEHANLVRCDSKRVELALIVKMIRLWHPGATRLLPLVFYSYCQVPLNQINLKIEGDVAPLQPGDIQRCLTAIPGLFARKFQTYNVFSATGVDHDSCINPEECGDALFQLSYSVMERKDIGNLPCPLEDLEKWCHKQEAWAKLCENCTDDIELGISRFRLGTWFQLGLIFDLPEWEVGDTLPEP